MASRRRSATDISFGADAKAESDMSIKTIDFPMETAAFDEKSGLSADEVEEVVRSTASVLTDGAVQVAALHYVDPLRFGTSDAEQAVNAPYGARIVEENVSVAPRAPADQDTHRLRRRHHPLHRRPQHQGCAGAGRL